MLLLDNSAWARISHQRLGDGRLGEVAMWMAQGELVTSLPFLLEAGHAAGSPLERQAMISDLRRLPAVAISGRIEARAFQGQSELAAVGRHRIPPSDLIVAACAEAVDGGVLHYDGDFDVILEHTSLAFESVWLAPRGTLQAG